MKANLLLYEKLINEDGSIVETKVWQVPRSSHYPLGVKYSLYWVEGEKVRVGYDNHFPKGHHRHYGTREEKYVWESVDQLIEDFKSDMRRLKP